VFLLLRGRFDRKIEAPLALVLADDEFERVRPGSRTFRTDGERVEVIQLRIDRARVRVPIASSKARSSSRPRAGTSRIG